MAGDESRMDGERMNELLEDQVMCRAAARALKGPPLDAVMVDLLKASDRYAARCSKAFPGRRSRVIARIPRRPGTPAVVCFALDREACLATWTRSSRPLRWTAGTNCIVCFARAYLSSLERNGD